MQFSQQNSVNDFVVLHFDVTAVQVASFLVRGFGDDNIDDFSELPKVVRQLLLRNGRGFAKEDLIVVEVPSNVDIVRANCYCFEFAQFGS
jgi:hypothetical protein